MAGGWSQRGNRDPSAGTLLYAGEEERLVAEVEGDNSCDMLPSCHVALRWRPSEWLQVCTPSRREVNVLPRRCVAGVMLTGDDLPYSKGVFVGLQKGTRQRRRQRVPRGFDDHQLHHPTLLLGGLVVVSVRPYAAAR